MVYLELIGIGVVAYYLVHIILWCVLDSDIELFVKEKTGKPISSLRGKVVWITGASSGIGAQLALTLAQHGVRLCLSARRADALRAIRTECIRRSAGQLRDGDADVLVLPMDMLHIDQHQQRFDSVLQHFGHVDVLVNNAGRSQRAQWPDVELRVDRDLFELDVFAVVSLTRVYLRYLLRSGCLRRGHAAVTSSICGLMAAPGSCSYTGAKFAIHGYFEGLKVEYPELDVTIFCPGPTTTAFLDNAFTGEVGRAYDGASASSGGGRMSAERCANLMAVALANGLFVNFAGVFPTPLLMNVWLYYPNVKSLVMNLLGKDGLEKVRNPEKSEKINLEKIVKKSW